MTKFFTNLLVVFLIMLGIIYLFSTIDKLNVTKKDVSLNELVLEIMDGKIKKIVVKPDMIAGFVDDKNEIVARKETSISLFETLKYYDVPTSTIQSLDISFKENLDWGGILTLGSMILLPVLIIAFFFIFMGKSSKSGPGQVFNFSQANLKQFLPNKDSIKFKDVAGLKEAKEELWEIVEFLKTPKKFTDLGAKIPKGVLLMGLPGTGKTLLARSVAGESGVPFFYISGSEFVEMFVGVGSSRVKSAFAIAKKSAPSILFIDEIDAIGRERGSGIGGGQDEREQTLNQILVEMDGFDKDTNVIVMGATNRSDVLDPALLRPGRFDRRIFLDLPDKEERKQILQIHLDNRKFDDKIDLNKIASRTPGFSGADLENLINEGTILAARRNKKKVEEVDLLESVEKVMMGPERKSHVVNQKEKEVTAYHEAGHAIIAALLPHANPVHKISILPRGVAAGYTLQLPEEDKYLKTKSEFLDELAVYLGGYVAEENKFGEITTGSSNDLKVASNSARAYVTKYGMSKLGPISFVGDESVFLGREMATRKTCSEEMASKIDEEVNRLIMDAHKKAETILAKNIDKLEKVAKVLLEKEVLEKDDFYNLMKE